MNENLFLTAGLIIEVILVKPEDITRLPINVSILMVMKSILIVITDFLIKFNMLYSHINLLS